MKKRILATLLSLCLVIGLLPVTAMADEAGEAGGETICAETEGCTLPNDHEGECAVMEDNQEESTPGTKTEGCTVTQGCTLAAGHEGECNAPVELKLADELEPLQDRINALPTGEDYRTMSDEEKDEAYENAVTISEDFIALSEEDRAKIDVAKLESLFAVINEDVATLEETAMDASPNYDWYGDGTSTSYTISNVSDLIGFANIFNGADGRTTDRFQGETVALANNIDLTGIAWTPIGQGAIAFQGTFDGQNHAILNLTIENADDWSGLFSQVGDGGCIRNVTLKNPKVIAADEKSCIGALAGGLAGSEGTALVENCQVVSSDSGAYYISGSASHTGGLLGAVTCGTVRNCYSNIRVVGGAHNVGGLAGLVRNAVVSDCRTDGEVNQNSRGTTYTGGLIGTLEAKDNKSTTIVRNITTGDFSGNASDSQFVGALIGGIGTTGQSTVLIENNIACGQNTTSPMNVCEALVGIYSGNYVCNQNIVTNGGMVDTTKTGFSAINKEGYIANWYTDTSFTTVSNDSEPQDGKTYYIKWVDPRDVLGDNYTVDTEGGSIDISVNADGSYTVTKNEMTVPVSRGQIIKLTSSQSSKAGDVKVTAADANITNDQYINEMPIQLISENLKVGGFTFKNVSADITLSGTSEVNSLNVRQSAQVVLHGDGTLNGSGWSGASDGGAGIVVSNHGGADSKLTINSGTIIASSPSSYSAGIGTKWYETCGTIIINGGTVRATGGDFASGIGGGENKCKNATIIINGGYVVSNGGKYAAAIGGGMQTPESHVTITGGTVIANAGMERRDAPNLKDTYTYSYAIGIGSESIISSKGTAYHDSTVTITGGAIYTSSKMLIGCSNVKNAAGNAVCNVMFTGLPASKEITYLTVDGREYGTKDAKTHEDGTLSVWIPSGENVRIELCCDGSTYSYQGEIAANMKIKCVESVCVAVFPMTYTDKDLVPAVNEYSGSVASWGYKIAFDPNGGTLMDATPITVEEGKAISSVSESYSLPAPIRAGYTFQGWYTAQTGGMEVTTNTVPTGNTTLYAQWAPNTYTVKFNANGGTGTMADESFTYDEAKALTANTFTKANHKFAGWATTSNGAVVYSNGTQVKNLTDVKDGTVTLYTVWVKKPVLTPDVTPQTKTYNSEMQSFTLDSGYTIIYKQNGTEATPKDVGAYDVVISKAESDDNAAFQTTIYDGLTITPAPLTITADNKTIYVGQALPEYTYTVTGLKGTDKLTKAPTVTCADADNSKAGTYTITASGATASENYTITYDPGTLTVYARSSGGGSSSGSNTSTSTSKNPDGSTTTTVTNKASGVTTETTKAKDGTTIVVTTDKKGNTTVTANVPSAAINAAKGEAVTLPTTVSEGDSVKITTAKAAMVEIPVEDVTPGTVAVIVNADGTEKIVSTSMVTENGVALKLDGSATVKIIDNSKSFTDVPATNVFYNEISSLSAREIMVGKTDDKFDLHSSVTLNQIANVAGRIIGAVDVKDFNAGVAWGAESGLQTGNVAATRGDVLKALYIAAGSPAVEDTAILARFKDAASIPADMAVIAAWAAQNGILKGNVDGSAGLGANVTRGQACALAGRTMGTLA